MKSRETVYSGVRHEPEKGTLGDALVFVDKRKLSPVPSQKIHNHSPDGFNWGYGGSGPAQLALGILLDYYGKASEKWKLYQQFKWRVIATLPQEENWTLTGGEIDVIMAELTDEHPEHRAIEVDP